MTNISTASVALPWEGPAIGLLDLDAFFASVEQLDHPEWRGKPVIVGGDADKRGVVSTASYEARAFGVHSAMPAAQARRLCPQGIWTHGHFDRYRELSSQVMEILTDETPRVEQVSVDEAFFDITPGRFSHEGPVEICQRMQARVSELGITCSIGLGVCKSVAKIASEAEKPRGLTIVLPGSEQSFLFPLPVRAMSGVGVATQHKLESMGIHTLGDLAHAQTSELENALGSVGPLLQGRAAGTERVPVAERAAALDPKSVSNERTFAHDLTDEREILTALAAVNAMVGRRLRHKGLAGSTVTLKIKLDYHTSKTVQTQLNEPTDDEATFGPVVEKLLRRIWYQGMPIRLIGVGLSDFGTSHVHQLDLFEDLVAQKKRATLRKLHQTTDSVKERFGDSALGFGREMRLNQATSHTAPKHKEND